MTEISRREFMALSGAATAYAMRARANGAAKQTVFSYGAHVYSELCQLDVVELISE